MMSSHQRLIAILFLFVVLLRPSSAAAHAALTRAEPAPDSVVVAPPTRVVIWFTEPVEIEFSEIQVFAADGTKVDNGDSQLLPDDPMAIFVTLPEEPPLPEGSYTVSWRNLSAVDGHPVSSSYLFSVGQPSTAEMPPPAPAITTSSPLEPFVRWLVLLAATGIFGGLSFDLFVVRPALSRFSREAILPEHRQRLSGRILNLVWLFMLLFLAASIGQLSVQTANVSSSPGVQSMLTLLNNTYWGQVWVWRMGCFLLLVGLLPLAARFNPERPWGSSWERPREGLALVGCATMMLMVSLVSHAAATTGIELTAVISDFLHLLAAGAWVGGLFHLAWNIPFFLRAIPEESRRLLLVAVVPRFSVLASLCVATLILTGLFSSYAQVTVLAALNTPYGRTLLIKLALIVPLLALGAVNLLWLRRRLAAEGGAGQHLGRTVRGEVALSIMVLLAVGFLVTMEPARQVASRESGESGSPALLTLQDTAEGLTGTFMVDSAGVGEKQVVIELSDHHGQPIENAADVIMTITYLAEVLQPPVGRPAESVPGRFEFNAVPFSLTGQWQANIVVIRPDAFDTRLAYTFEIGRGESSALPNSGTIAPDMATAGWLFFIMLALVGVVATVTYLKGITLKPAASSRLSFAPILEQSAAVGEAEGEEGSEEEDEDVFEEEELSQQDGDATGRGDY